MSHKKLQEIQSAEGSDKKVEHSLLVGLLLSAVGLLLGRLLIKPRSKSTESGQKELPAKAVPQLNHVEKGIMLWDDSFHEPTWTPSPSPAVAVQSPPSSYTAHSAKHFFQEQPDNDMLLLPPSDAELQKLGYPATPSTGSLITANLGGYMNGLPWTEPLVQADVAVEPTTTWKAIAHEFFETIVLTLVIFVLMRALIQNYRIEGYSMEPNLHEQQYLIVNKVVYYLGEPQRGDIIVFEYPKGDPNGPERDYIKRIIGLPGDTIECRPNEIYVNGELIDEPYKPNPWSYSCSPITLGIDEYYVLGDNRPQSSDSHQWGPLQRKYIIGKAWLSYWPYEHWGWVPNYPIQAPPPEPPAVN